MCKLFCSPVAYGEIWTVIHLSCGSEVLGMLTVITCCATPPVLCSMSLPTR